MKCDIIRDLLPSYIDGLTSGESNHLVDNHLETCEDCKRFYMQMKREISNEKDSISKNINPFIKIKKDAVRKIILAIVITASICAVLWETYQDYYFGGKSMMSKEVTVSLGKMHGITTLSFEPKDNNVIVSVGYRENKMVNGKMPVATLGLIKRNKHQKNNTLDSNQFSLYFVDEDTLIDLFSVANELEYEDNDFYAVEYDDGIQIIYLEDLKNGKIENKIIE